MSSKNISIRDDVYRELSEAKGPDESFSDVIDRLLEKDSEDHPLRRLEGLLDEEEATEVRERMEDFRESLDDQMDRYA
jgi:predicted CopG family antitoxin